MRIHGWKRVLIGAVLLVALAACGGDKKDDKGKAPDWKTAVASLAVTHGSATLTPGGGTPRQLLPDQPPLEVRAGDQINTSEEGEAVLTYYSGAQTFLAPASTLEVTAFDTLGESSRVDVRLLVGQTFSSVEKTLDANSSFAVTTSVAAITVRGTRFGVFVRANSLTQVVSTDGTVMVQAGDKSAEVPRGYGVPVQPDGTLGEVKVWGQAQIQLTTPSGEAPNLPVLFTKTDNGQTFRYRVGDLMTAPLGIFDVLVQSPGPLRLAGIEFKGDTTTEKPLVIPVTLGAIVLDAAGVGDVRVQLQQGDLSGETVVAPGAPILAGAGTWQLTVAPTAQPDQTQTLEVTVVEGEQITVEVDPSKFDAGGR